MIRLLENDSIKELKKYDTVEYAGHEWYIVSLDSKSAILLLKDDVRARHIFDTGSTEYAKSAIRKYLLQQVLPKLVSKGANPKPARLPDSGVSDKLWLLSVDEAEKIPKGIRKFPDRWWLRTPSYNPGCVADVFSDGDIIYDGFNVPDYKFAVRPAMWVDLEELQ